MCQKDLLATTLKVKNGLKSTRSQRKKKEKEAAEEEKKKRKEARQSGEKSKPRKTGDKKSKMTSKSLDTDTHQTSNPRRSTRKMAATFK